jgi:hypothetical protein
MISNAKINTNANVSTNTAFSKGSGGSLEVSQFAFRFHNQGRDAIRFIRTRAEEAHLQFIQACIDLSEEKKDENIGDEDPSRMASCESNAQSDTLIPNLDDSRVRQYILSLLFNDKFQSFVDDLQDVLCDMSYIVAQQNRDPDSGKVTETSATEMLSQSQVPTQGHFHWESEERETQQDTPPSNKGKQLRREDDDSLNLSD